MPRVIFLHGWSVTNTDTYGELPSRLVREAEAQNIDISVQHIYLGRYVSFQDEVRVPDLAFAMEHAVATEGLSNGERFYCITHSTGGPVVREWVERYHRAKSGCPMSHLVMLAPANFGSALATLGKSRVGRLKAWLNGVEPGQGVLDWLCLGSSEANALNLAWIREGEELIGPEQVFPFVLSGQTIDRKLYDNLNSYTGEPGSDGVVRVASANLNASYAVLKQSGLPDAKKFSVLELAQPVARPPAVPFRVIKGASHSGTDSGIMRSVAANLGGAGEEVVKAILRCLSVTTRAGYDELAAQFIEETRAVQEEERVERVKSVFQTTREFVHDRYAQLIFRVRDSDGQAVPDFDLLLTAGSKSSPNHLPEGFFQDRQANQQTRGVITYYLNYDILVGGAEIPGVREGNKGVEGLGLELHPRPEDGFVHFRKCRAPASSELLSQLVRPNETTFIDILLTRVVHDEVLRLDPTTTPKPIPKKPGPAIN